MMDKVKEENNFTVDPRNIAQHVLKYKHGTIGHGMVKEAQLQRK